MFPSENYTTLSNFYASFPVLTFTFDLTKPVYWHPEDYLFHAKNTNYYCVGVQPLRDVIIGAIFMRNYDIFFDKTTRTVSLVRANCSFTPDSIPFISTGFFKRRKDVYSDRFPSQ